LDTFKARGYKDLDTSRNYPPGKIGPSEEMLGKLNAASTFTIYTKVVSEGEGAHRADRLAQSVEASFEALKTDHVETMYLHFPDRTTPIEETLGAMDAACRAGKFNTYGISNYTPDEVQRIFEICENKAFSKPSVYQGHYNVLTRGAEEKLIPLLREHNVAYHIYRYAPESYMCDH
jgi:aflatoxin B1 aldehyde reductase